MIPSSTLVNVSDDAELRLITLLSANNSAISSTFPADCQKCLDSGDAAAFVKTVMGDAGALQALLTLQESEAAAACTVLAALSERAASNKAFASLIVKLPSVKSMDEQAAAGRKILLLSILYNLCSNLAEKVELLKHIFALAAKDPSKFLGESTAMGKLLVPADYQEAEDGSSGTSTGKNFRATKSVALPRLVALLNAWKISPKDHGALYKSVVGALEKKDFRRQRFLLLWVETFKTAASVDAVGIKAAEEAAIGAVRDPVTLFVAQRTLLTQPGIQALKKSDGVLFELLSIFQEGNLSDYTVFAKSNKGAFAKYQLDESRCERHIKILSLCSLASEHEVIPYKDVAKALSVSEDQVESWVIAAVGSGLLQAKMDQMTQTVLVERSVVRKFDMAQWKALQSRLSLWKENVGGILAGLRQQNAAMQQ